MDVHSGRASRDQGDIYPLEQKQKETRVIVKIEPIKVSLDAIFNK